MTLTIETRHRLGDFRLDGAFSSDGGVTALFGRSGSGKTSMLRIIAGLTRPDHGRLVLDDNVLVDTDRGIFVPMHRRRFGVVFQEARLFPHLDTRQNLTYGRWFAQRAGRRESFDRIVAMLGIEPLLERRPAKLSGGEKQRVAIGRALLSSPRLLLMDEPLAALDDARKAEILPYLERLRDETNIPIVYVSHSVSEVARLANRIIVMRNGKVEATGTAADILGRPSLTASTGRRETGALLDGIVEHYDPAHRLTTIALGATRLYVPGGESTAGSRVRVHIPARDVMLATVKPEGISALNILEGTISDLQSDSDCSVNIRIDCSGTTILSRITGLSCERLALAPAKPVFAIIKTVALEPH